MSSGSPATLERAFREWLAKADSDLLNIDNNLASASVPWDTVCFHAQQAAEKSLKAFLIRRGIAPQRTHDLIAVLGECEVIDPALGRPRSDCDLLNTYAVATRYPGSGVEPTAADGPCVVAAARRVRAAVDP